MFNPYVCSDEEPELGLRIRPAGCRFPELDYPIVARAVCTLSLNQDLRTDHMAFIDVRQNGVTCLAGTSSGRLFDTEERYQRIRSKTRVMNERYAEEFARAARAPERAA